MSGHLNLKVFSPRSLMKVISTFPIVFVFSSEKYPYPKRPNKKGNNKKTHKKKLRWYVSNSNFLKFGAEKSIALPAVGEKLPRKVGNDVFFL